MGYEADLLREAVEDVDQLGQLLATLRLAFRDAVGHAAVDVMLEDRETDAIERGFGGRQLLEYLNTQAGFLNHAANSANLTLDPVQAGDEGLLF